jgi:hypothetical protein
MKTRSFLLCLLLIGIPIAVLAQSVVITPKKTVYRRPKPMHEGKRTFSIRRPIAKAATPALSKKMTAAISPDSVLEINLRKEMGEYQWLEEADYKTLYNSNGILSMELWMTGSGAYPDDVTKRVVVDLKTGNRVPIALAFSKLPQLATLIRKAQIAEVKKAIEEMKNNPDAPDGPDELFGETNFTTADLNEFSVNDTGVTFYYDYGFPHVLAALEPAGEFTFSWQTMKPFIRRDGLLAQFVR